MKWWAIKTPRGRKLGETVNASKWRCQHEYTRQYPGGTGWWELEALGYRCVRVRIVEVKTKGKVKHE